MLYHAAGAAGKAASKQEEKQKQITIGTQYVVSYDLNLYGRIGGRGVYNNVIVSAEKLAELEKQHKEQSIALQKHNVIITKPYDTPSAPSASMMDDAQQQEANADQSAVPAETKAETKQPETKQPETSKQGRWLPARVVSTVACKKCEVRIQIYERKKSECNDCEFVWKKVGCPIVVNRNSEKLADFKSPCKGLCEKDKLAFLKHVKPKAGGSDRNFIVELLSVVKYWSL